jgi:UDP-2,4-diacetamido-2,4,6-trideoxy-beta-L-altropyranose hydrolase
MKVAFRTDATPQIGTGHFMRCMTLADALVDALAEGEATIRFLSRHLPEHLVHMVRERGYEFSALDDAREGSANDLAHAAWLEGLQQTDALQTGRALAGQKWDWLVVDHYAIDARWETALRGSVRRILVIDDLADRMHDCDLLLDQNLYLDREVRYLDRVPSHCKILTGPRYALLREEFPRRRATVSRRAGPVRRVLVFFGGVDADNYTGRTLDALKSLALPELDVEVVIGPQHPARARIEAACRERGHRCHVQTSSMAELMARADLGIGAGGAATWERCCLGLPTLTLCVADNQRKLVADCSRSGVIHAPEIGGDFVQGMARHISVLIENPGLREFMSAAGMEAVDGEGVSRVIGEMRGRRIDMRPVSRSDSANLLAWRNHPSVRNVSRNQDMVSAEAHEEWLERTLADPERVLLIGEQDGHAVGVMRFDIEGQAAEVSIYLVPGLAGRGLGRALLGSAEQWLREQRPQIKRLDAEVLGENAPSHAMFQSAGYLRQATRYSKEVG